MLFYILAVVTDNASNNTTMMKEMQNRWRIDGLDFDYKQNHVRCIAHVINIAIQSALTVLCCRPPNDAEDDGNAPDCLKKVKIKNKKSQYILYFLTYCYIL